MSRIDSEDVVCIDGQGVLVLSLTRESYQQLGLVGRPSRFARGASGRTGDRHSGAVSRYIVELPLRAPSFVSGKRGFERARHCLDAWDRRRAAALGLSTVATWPMMCVWSPPMSQTQKSQRIWAPIEFPSVQTEPLPLNVHMDVLDDVWIPCGQASLHECLEYTALASMHASRLKTFDRVEPHVALYAPPDPSTPGSLLHLRFRGIYPPSLAAALIDALQSWMETCGAASPWAAITAIGFADAPVAWQSRYPGLGLALGSGHSLGDAPPDDGWSAVQRASKVRRKGHIRRGESEHGFLRTGEHGWTLLVGPRPVLVESVEMDTHT